MLVRQGTVGSASLAPCACPRIPQLQFRNRWSVPRHPYPQHRVLCRGIALGGDASASSGQTPAPDGDATAAVAAAPGAPAGAPGTVLGVVQGLGFDVARCGAHLKETLEDIRPKLSRFSGLPVVEDSGKVVGVITRKDVDRVRQAGESMQQLVEAKMTQPAVTILGDASTQEAADLMQLHQIWRLPVVDADGLALGIVSRNDVQPRVARAPSPSPATAGRVKARKQLSSLSSSTPDKLTLKEQLARTAAANRALQAQNAALKWAAERAALDPAATTTAGGATTTAGGGASGSLLVSLGKVRQLVTAVRKSEQEAAAVYKALYEELLARQTAAAATAAAVAAAVV